MEKEELNALIKRYVSGQATEQDYMLLDSWYLKLYEERPVMEISFTDRVHDLNKIKSALDRRFKKISVKLWPGVMTAAASVLLILGLFLYFYPSRVVEHNKAYNSSYANDIAPGKDRATLVLSNGSSIDLLANPNSRIIQAGAQITNTKKGELQYTATSDLSLSPEYNTIKVPKGGKYVVCLPDGTKVWLNAASTLKYPTTFTSLKERRVELSGEAYFEVTRNEKLPFRVATVNQVAEVLGTHFNINSYSNEIAVKTTLIEGSIRINQRITLNPGQQAVNYGSSIFVDPVDPENVTDWKDGKFSFNKGEEFMYAMRKIERWYDVEVVYEGSSLPKLQLRGEIPRENPISTVLHSIEKIGKVKFKIEGRRVIVRATK